MKKPIQGIAAALVWSLAVLPLRAEVIRCDGILGNSGEQGATLVRFNESKPARGLGVVTDRFGTFWDRAGAGRLNRYAADGRLLASYQIPAERSSSGDAVAAVGDKLILCVDGGLHTLSIDAPADSTSSALKIDAEHMSLSSHDGWVVASKGPVVFLVNAAGTKKPVITLQREPQELVIGPDATVVVVQEGKAYRVAGDAPGGLAPVGTIPGERAQFLEGFVYGAGWGSALRRFDSAWQPAPGVVLGGNSGSFIGHVDEQSEIINPRGVAKAPPDLFAVSGYNGILHLLQWRELEQRLMPVRRIGSTVSCPALALDREGRTWWLSGNWNWNDGPATPLHFGIPEPEVVFGLAVQNSDSIVGFGRMWGMPTVISGKLDKEVRVQRIETPTVLPKEGAVAVAVSERNKRPVLLVLERTGGATAVAISDTGDYQGDIGRVQFLTAEPVKQWTSLTAVRPDTLIGAGDGFVIELAQEGENWKETRRWNSWGPDPVKKFGGPIWLSADDGRLWVSDSKRHRVVCFDLASNAELAAFGKPDAAGDDLFSLSTPCTIAARGRRAVVFDGDNQRLFKLRITNE